MILPISFKKIIICGVLTTGLAACGGGGDDGGKGPNPDTNPNNNAPTVTSFSAQTSTTSLFEVTFSWEVADSDNDALACVLSTGDSQANIDIADCKATTSATVTYQAAGSYSANLAVSDPSNASANSDFALSLVDENTLPDPVVSAGDNELVIFYNRSDDNYEHWVLHLWNGDGCIAYADFADDEGTVWALGQAANGEDANYGAYWILPLKTDHNGCANFIVHNGDEKDIGGDTNNVVDLTGEHTIWTLSGNSELYTEAILASEGVFIEGASAHWLTASTVLLPIDNAAEVRIYHSATADLAFDAVTGITGDNYITFTASTLSENEAALVPHIKDSFAAYATNADLSLIKAALKGELVAIAYSANGEMLSATRVQIAKALDDIYTSGDNDANEAILGLVYTANNITASVWAPTAQSVALHVFDKAKTLTSTETMILDAATGIWSFTGDKVSYDRQFFRYQVSVYHPVSQKIENIWSTDPYSVSLATNGLYSQFVNLNDDDLKPVDWDNHLSPTIAEIEDAVILEAHIRDFSITDSSTTAQNRGKYLAFTETDSNAVQYLKSLADAGVTHFHMLPANDIATIKEGVGETVNIHNTVAELCILNASAPVCGVEDNSATILSVLESYQPTSNDAKDLVASMRGIDSFNWGYDPHHFNAPEGSYASNADGVTRIKEMREMNKALHDLGFRVVLDVVYNHTSASGLWDNSVFDKMVPGYYHRYNEISGDLEKSTCCDNTATEHVMMGKFVIDSLVQWTKQYKFDSFRFDIMGHMPKATILAARAAVQAIDPDNYFYGEGWNWGEVVSGRLFDNAIQQTMAGSEVGTFNDRPRDAIREAVLSVTSPDLNKIDKIRRGLAATLQNYQLQDFKGVIKLGRDFSDGQAYALDPADIINYVSKHDNETLWDYLQYNLPTAMLNDDRVRVHNLSASIPLLSQGIPFFQLGLDKMRSKSMDRNTYDAGDWYNAVDYSNQSNNWQAGTPIDNSNDSNLATIASIKTNVEIAVDNNDIEFSSAIFAEFLAIRSDSPLFRLTTEQDVINRVGFHNTGSSQTPGLIVMSIDDGTGGSTQLKDLDNNYDAIVVVINGTDAEQSHTISTATDFALHSIQLTSADTSVQTASFTAGTGAGTFTVPAYTSAVFVKAQVGAQGAGLAAGITRDAVDVAPYGDTVIYLRGSMNNWSSEELTDAYRFIYEENDIYSLNVNLTAGQQSFKFADAQWANLNLGFNDVSFTASSITVNDDGGNMTFSVASDGIYSFTIDASAATAQITITSIALTVDCRALIDSADAIPFDIAGGGELYVKGNHSGWGANELYRLHYKGNNIYQAVADFAGDMQFKLASDDDDWTTQLWVQAEASNDISSDNLAVGVNYVVAYDDGGTDNNVITLEAGSYSFLLTLNEANPSQGANVGSLIIQQCQP
ncbi:MULTISPECIES: alpha-1,6-glucosidase domain-containing protein [Colwellia]|uniref:Pullulanase n=1 Tax=Colwellia marinimaniae TaxID=1513592 RepID=A0ABQ0MTA3_9GAMM|nr:MULTISPECIES: alpha-1,6-glucosidase domain-containing protein [Colwellia]GAW95603.1 pullulanase [Colwellia marinimaniae]